MEFLLEVVLEVALEGAVEGAMAGASAKQKGLRWLCRLILAVLCGALAALAVLFLVLAVNKDEEPVLRLGCAVCFLLLTGLTACLIYKVVKRIRCGEK